jgi:phosphoribosylaminoimidazole carboxylase PurE protein
MPVRISIIMGSQSDLETVGEAVELLKKFDISFEIKVLSAHRTPKELARYVEKAPARGIKLFIAAAGGAAALAGVVAAHTTLPVIGIPIETSSLKGLDSLLATVQMPAGIPVDSWRSARPVQGTQRSLDVRSLRSLTRPSEKSSCVTVARPHRVSGRSGSRYERGKEGSSRPSESR